MVKLLHDYQKNIQTPYIQPLLPPEEKYYSAISSLWKKKQLTNNGENTIRLTHAIERITHQKNIVITSSGTMALLLAIKTLGLTGEVITSPFVFPAVPHALSFCGLTPVFCDVLLKTGNINPALIESKITKKTSAILAVHNFGNPCEIEKITAIAKKYALKVIFDAAPAFGVRYKNKNIVDYGDATIHSYHATKIFHTIEGGAIFFRNQNHRKIAESLREFGFDNSKNKIILPGINGKMSEFHAAMGLSVLPLINKEIQKRHIYWDCYTKELKNAPHIIIPIKTQNAQTYTIRITNKKRDYVYQQLKKKGIATKIYYAQIATEYPHYHQQRTSLENAKQLARESLSLPLFGNLSQQEIKIICAIIYKCVRTI
jgi:dTDP-4-amino-4,6-dideoxygalactose transaminase